MIISLCVCVCVCVSVVADHLAKLLGLLASVTDSLWPCIISFIW